MNKILVGVNMPEDNPNPAFIREKLHSFRRDGFECVEISLDILPSIIGGKINREYVSYLSNLLREYDFKYSGHIGLGVDLRDIQHYKDQRNILLASIKLCNNLALNPLVLHYEAKSKDALTEQKFLDAHIEASDLAAQCGITLCIENIEVERIEPLVEFVQREGKPNFRIAFDTGHAFLAAVIIILIFLKL